MPNNILKKGQVNMFETVAVVIIFFILLAGGLIFYSTIQRSSIADKIRKGQDAAALKAALTAMRLPELQCSRVHAADNCYDLLKMQIMETKLSDPDYKKKYRELLPNTELIISQTYPDTCKIRSEAECEIRISTALTQNTQTKKSTWFPITIYNPAEDSSYLGILTVNTYQ